MFRRHEARLTVHERCDRMTIQVDRLSSIDDSQENRSVFESCLEIRRIVFIVGQKVPVELEYDGLDEEAEHFIARRVDGAAHQPIGTARMRRLGREAKAERVAVLEAERESGVGRRLMQAIESRAKELKLDTLVLHAQVSVIQFYETLGYVAHGQIFNEAGIDHREMTKRII